MKLNRSHQGVQLENATTSRVVVSIALVLMFGRAFLVGPVRSMAGGYLSSLEVPIPTDTVIPLVAFIVGIYILALRRHAIVQRDTATYGVLLFLIVLAVLISELVRSGGNGPAGFVVVLTLSACLVWFAALSQSEKVLLLRWSLLVFFAYVFVNLVYWIIILDPFDNPSAGAPYRRMGGALATVVHLGVLIPSITALWIGSARSILPTLRRWNGVIIGIATIALVATASRTGAALMLATFGTLMVRAQTRMGRVGGVSAILVVAWIAGSGIVDDFRYLAFSLEAGGRLQSWTAAVIYWFDSGLYNALFGSGWGGVYPYWDWIQSGGITWGGSNRFLLGGEMSLVSPHNSVVWLLVEGGLIVGLAAICWLSYPLWRVIGATRLRSHSAPLLIGASGIIALFLVSDVMVTSPGTAWMSLLLIMIIGAVTKSVLRNRWFGVV